MMKKVKGWEREETEPTSTTGVSHLDERSEQSNSNGDDLSFNSRDA